MSRSLLERLEAMAPEIEWTTPIPARMYPTEQYIGFLCRICVAQLGFKAGQDTDRVFFTEEACLKHIADAHVAR